MLENLHKEICFYLYQYYGYRVRLSFKQPPVTPEIVSILQLKQ